MSEQTLDIEAIKARRETAPDIWKTPLSSKFWVAIDDWQQAAKQDIDALIAAYEAKCAEVDELLTLLSHTD